MKEILRIRVELEIVVVTVVAIVEVAVIVEVKNKVVAKKLNKTERIAAIFLILPARNIKVIWIENLP